MVNMKSSTLYYIHDPMCSWCWGFNKTWNSLVESLPNEIKVRYVLGGLAPDSSEPMDARTREYIQRQWCKIQQQIDGVEFNFDFWEVCQPKRSTYIACRAVIAAKNQDPKYELPMIHAIQIAYYQRAQNTSEKTALINLARELSLDIDSFTQALNANSTQAQLDDDIALTQDLGVSSFPSLVLLGDGVPTNIGIDYNHAQPMLEQILTWTLVRTHW